MNKNYESIHRYDFLTKELLEEEYVKNGLTDQQICNKYDMPSKAVVWRKRKKYGIANRYGNKSNKNASKNRKFAITKQEAEFLLEQGKTYKEIAEHMGCSIIVAKRRFKELGLVKEQEKTESFTYWDVELSDGQKQLIIGSLLGDGGITESNAYACTHSIVQSEYFFHKMDRLSSIHSGKCWNTKGIAPNGTKTKGIRFTTGCNKFIAKLRPIYYPSHGKKVFPHDFAMENLEKEGLAYWYMDDGSWNIKNKISSLQTQCFSYEEHEILQKFFAEKFNIDVRIHKSGYIGTFTLGFTVKSSQQFLDLVRPFIADCMMYKTGNSEAYKKWRSKQDLYKES